MKNIVSNQKESDDKEEHRYLSDIMTSEEYEYIGTLNGVIKFITAGTGAGKTHWMINKFCKDNSKESNVLILCNRSALKDQTVMDFSKACKSLEEALSKLGIGCVSEEICRRIKFGKVDIMTYHSLVDIEVEQLNKYDHIICDECHFLLQDSTFNDNCELIMDKLLKIMKCYGRNLIMITATEFQIMKLLNYLNYSEERCNLKLFDYNKYINSFDRINFVCCSKSAKKVMESVPDGEKCLIFTRAKKSAMEKLASKFESADYIYSRWISDPSTRSFSMSKEMAEKHKNLIENNMFESKYLIANSSIDNGISFHDPKLRTIIIDNIFDMVQVIQMIGRKRFDFDNPNDKITVYLVSNKNKAEEELSYLSNVVEMIEDYQKMSNEQTIGEKVKFNDKWGNFIGNENGLTADNKKVKQIAVYRGIENFQERFYLRRFSALKSMYTQMYLDEILSIPTEILDKELPKLMEDISGLNYKIAMAISQKYGKNIDEIEIDNGRRNTKIKKSAEVQYNLRNELIPYLKEVIEIDYLFGQDKTEFIRTMQQKFGAGDSEEYHSNLRIGSINEVIKQVGYIATSKAKKISGKTETVWIVQKV
ncbi:DEAD/DEAH box helicase family protein [Clostridium botulinum]|uniref:DEAD/DEAH box helicase family protein n=1 Tax=Clostridium botulinum TaxID=1491 RepID=UPI0019683BEC|nr:DEAD/DEAH box helicase family protein [Clostridium botulinum]MBN1079345.1 hypothetical protein [Clostridium botulinum]